MAGEIIVIKIIEIHVKIMFFCFVDFMILSFKGYTPFSSTLSSSIVALAGFDPNFLKALLD